MNKNRYAYGYEVPLNVPTQSVPVITDILNGKHYYSLREIVNLLNEQQSIIRKDEISIETMMSNMEKLEKENKQLKEENERLKEKLNVTALELVDEVISMGKAVEISEMNYHEFLEYRKKKGKAMELQR